MDVFNQVWYFFIDPSSIGFPILIGIGMWLIVFLMNKETKVWKQGERRIKQIHEKTSDPDLPFKPF